MPLDMTGIGSSTAEPLVPKLLQPDASPPLSILIFSPPKAALLIPSKSPPPQHDAGSLRRHARLRVTERRCQLRAGERSSLASTASTRGCSGGTKKPIRSVGPMVESRLSWAWVRGRCRCDLEESRRRRHVQFPLPCPPRFCIPILSPHDSSPLLRQDLG